MRCSILGDVFNVISLSNILVYACAVILYARVDEANLFDEEWLREGFCVVNKDVPFWNSHDMCLYLDVVLVGLGLAVYFYLKDEPGLRSANDIVWWNLLGHLGHGLAHGALGAKYRNGNGAVEENEGFSTAYERLQHHQWDGLLYSVAPAILFWFGLLKGVMVAVPSRFVLVVAALATLGQLFVRNQFAFMYTQTILGIAFTVTQTQRPKHEKDFAYASFAFMGIVLGVIPWVESTACQSFASRFGGHLMYDAAIPALLMIVYCVCYFKARSSSLKEKQI